MPGLFCPETCPHTNHPSGGSGGGSGDMLKSVYDADSTVEKAGGIKAYISNAIKGLNDALESINKTLGNVTTALDEINGEVV